MKALDLLYQKSTKEVMIAPQVFEFLKENLNFGPISDFEGP